MRREFRVWTISTQVRHLPPVLRILLMLLEVVIEFMKSQERKMKAKKKNGNEKEWFH